MNVRSSLASLLASLLPAESLPEGSQFPTGPAGVRVSPGSTDEVAQVMAWASREGVRVVPIGSGRRAIGVSPEEAHVVLDTRRLSGITTYEAPDLTVTAGAGTTLEHLDAALAPNGQWLPFDPPAAPERSLGGFVARGDSGPLSAGYGGLRNHVLGATLVTGDGRVLMLGGRVVKNVAGFDLLRPVVGSRGGLGVITSACLRLFPRPEMDLVLAARAAEVQSLVETARALVTAPIVPASCVVVSPSTALGGQAAAIVRLQGAPSTVVAERGKLERCLGAPLEALEGDAAGSAVRAARDHAAEDEVVLRVAFLPARLGEVVSLVSAMAETATVQVDVYAGRARVGLRLGSTSDLPTFRKGVEALGGSVGVDRWPGSDLPDGVPTRPTDAEAQMGARVRSVFDPKGVLWSLGQSLASASGPSSDR